MMFPLYSILRESPGFAKPPAQFVLLHLKRSHLMEWVRAVIAVTLGVAPHAPLPPVIMQKEQPQILLQTGEPLHQLFPILHAYKYAGNAHTAAELQRFPDMIADRLLEKNVVPAQCDLVGGECSCHIVLTAAEQAHPWDGNTVPFH